MRLILTGLLFFAAALSFTAYNLYDNYRAGKTAGAVVSQLQEIRSTEPPSVQAEALPEQTETEPTEPAVQMPEGPMPEQRINGQDYIGTLKLVKHGLELPVISWWDYPKLKIAPCRYEGSVYTDDMIISAHNYRSQFGLITELDPGDEVTFTDMAGNVFSYEVTRRETLKGNDIEEMSEGEWDLTLFTCTIGGANRVTVRCRRVDMELAAQTEAVSPMEEP